MNKIFITGSLGRDPEARYSQTGTAVTSFSVACNSGYGEHKRVDWFDTVCFGKTAELMGNSLHKGSKVLVEGELNIDSWSDKTTGQKKYRTKIIANHIEFLDTKKDTTDKFAEQFGGTVVPDDSEIPF